MYLIRTRITSRFCAMTLSSARLNLREKLVYHRSMIDRPQRLEDSAIPAQTDTENAVRPAKAGAFSGRSQSRQGKSQEPCSLSRRQEGNQMI